jgi:hypothetical protein
MTTSCQSQFTVLIECQLHTLEKNYHTHALVPIILKRMAQETGSYLSPFWSYVYESHVCLIDMHEQLQPSFHCCVWLEAACDSTLIHPSLQMACVNTSYQSTAFTTG